MILETERLVIRNWRDDRRDRALFHEINSDPEIMTFFPRRRTPEESDQLFDKMRNRIAETGYGFYALALKTDDKPIGFCGLQRPDPAPILKADAVEIGWRLARPFWGRGYVTEAGKALFAYGFDTLSLPEIVSFAVAENHRSIAVMQRLGMRPTGSFDHPLVPDDTPHLKRHVLYALTAEQWRLGTANAAITPSAR
ncbi:GNAT family N-acetyltransferase [Pararhizobium arenae]|uniref:GNAT family N-acetyltransferase n=1 Tax=Pararhizobium arenae TaxID=1856850 RepID=UPI00094B240D|nr:GNAT family N-acetyltransferase [Pararhizobium arenae]